jgi:hypothetical protein
MNAHKQAELKEQAPRSPFWVCFIVFLFLAGDYGFRLSNLVQQRAQLEQSQTIQALNAATLTQAQQLEARIQALSLELLQLANTNAAAKRIVQDFNIQWTPDPTPSAPAQVAPLAPDRQKK